MATFEDYSNFVRKTSSKETNSFTNFENRLKVLKEKGVDVQRLLCGAIGLSSESGELLDIIKKIVFQGKNLDKATKSHITKELGDVMWYFSQVCISLQTDTDFIIRANVSKLSERYDEKLKNKEDDQ